MKSVKTKCNFWKGNRQKSIYYTANCVFRFFFCKPPIKEKLSGYYPPINLNHLESKEKNWNRTTDICACVGFALDWLRDWFNLPSNRSKSKNQSCFAHTVYSWFKYLLWVLISCCTEAEILLLGLWERKHFLFVTNDRTIKLLLKKWPWQINPLNHTSLQSCLLIVLSLIQGSKRKNSGLIGLQRIFIIFL